jgi:hypothetical protein
MLLDSILNFTKAQFVTAIKNRPASKLSELTDGAECAIKMVHVRWIKAYPALLLLRSSVARSAPDVSKAVPIWTSSIPPLDDLRQQLLDILHLI